jgi:hypothetical protein
MSDSKKPIYTKWWFWVGIFFILIIATSSGPNEPQEVAQDDSQQEQIEMVFDGPHLLSLTIDEVRNELGMPIEETFIDPTEEQIALGNTTWNNQYEKDGYMILIDWDIATREVTGFFISTDDPTETIKDWSVLLDVMNISADTNQYNIEPVEAFKYPGEYTGVNVTE